MKNSLIFEANKRLYDFNAKILEEKKEQAQKLFDLEIALKKEKTRNNQLKSMKRFEVSGEIKTDKIKYNWDFRKTEDYKKLELALKDFGFSNHAIIGLWWKIGKNGLDLNKLLNYVEYTLLKAGEGKVKNLQKFLYHALQAKYDIGELIKLRFEALSREEKIRREDEARARERQAWADEEREREEARERNDRQLEFVKAWIRQNQDSELYEEVLGQLEVENSFVFSRLVKSARKYEFRNVVEFMKSDKMSAWDLGLSGVWERVVEIVGSGEILTVA